MLWPIDVFVSTLDDLARFEIERDMDSKDRRRLELRREIARRDQAARAETLQVPPLVL